MQFVGRLLGHGLDPAREKHVFVYNSVQSKSPNAWAKRWWCLDEGIQLSTPISYLCKEKACLLQLWQIDELIKCVSL